MSESLYKLYTSKMTIIIFVLIHVETMTALRPGTRSFHYIPSISETNIAFKMY